MQIVQIIKLIDALFVGIELVKELIERRDNLVAVLQQMVDAGREPTDEEWDALINRMRSLAADIMTD